MRVWMILVLMISLLLLAACGTREPEIESVDIALTSMEGDGADPLLLVQDIPELFTVDEAVVSGD